MAVALVMLDVPFAKKPMKEFLFSIDEGVASAHRVVGASALPEEGVVSARRVVGASARSEEGVGCARCVAKASARSEEGVAVARIGVIHR